MRKTLTITLSLLILAGCNDDFQISVTNQPVSDGNSQQVNNENNGQTNQSDSQSGIQSNDQVTNNDNNETNLDNSQQQTDNGNTIVQDPGNESNVSEIYSPLPTFIIKSNSVTFQFQDKGRMWLDIGTSLNASDIHNNSVTGTTFTLNELPIDINRLYATLWTFTNNTWEKHSYQWQVMAVEDNDSSNDTSENNSTENNNTASQLLQGKEIWQLNCTNSSCHSGGAIDGVFSTSSLKTKGIYNTLDLTSYIDKYMPLINPSTCTGDCAQNVSTYIATWHQFPQAQDNNQNTDQSDDQTNNQTGTPRNPIVTEQCSVDTSMGYQTVRLLTRAQYQNSVQDLLGVNFDITEQLPVDLESGAFTNNNQLNVIDSSYIAYVGAADEIASWSTNRNFSDFLTCSSFNQSCATNFIDNVAWKIIRRPFNNTEREQYLSLARGDQSSGDVKAGIELALSGLLASPQFLYRHEIGEPVSGLGQDVFELTPFEMGTYLSYAFSNSTPDNTLLNAAVNNQLQTKAQIESQVSRLLDSNNAQDMMGGLVHKWLDTDFIVNQTKDNSQFANFDQIAPHMVDELSKTFSHVMLDKQESFDSLYNANYAFVNQPLASHYGLSSQFGNELKKVYNQERGGILLSGAFLSRWAHNDETNAVTRAVHIRRDMLCQDIPEPPTGVSLSLQDKQGELASILADPTTTQRQAFKHTTEFGSCSSCHNEIINPLGFGLEDFNAVGVKRTVDANGNNIDASGALWSPFLQLQFYDDEHRIKEYSTFNGGKELANLMVNDPKISGLAKSCLAKQMLSYVSGIDARSYADSERENVTQFSSTEKNSYTCDVIDLVDTLENQSPRRMLESIGSLESIRYRKAWSR